MQPTYIPWLGYFALINQVDKFVFLDNVQFNSRSWQQRNRILNQGKPQWLTVPVKLPNGRNTTIKDVAIDYEQSFPKHHIDSIKRNYAKSAGYQDIENLIFPILDLKLNSLPELNKRIIVKLCQKLEIDTKFINSSELKSSGKRGELLLAITKELEGTTYVSAAGSEEYLREFDGFKTVGIHLEYQRFFHPEYKQKECQFVSHLSIVDAIANEGIQKVREMIKVEISDVTGKV